MRLRPGLAFVVLQRARVAVRGAWHARLLCCRAFPLRSRGGRGYRV
jgi:hypothetical protein